MLKFKPVLQSMLRLSALCTHTHAGQEGIKCVWHDVSIKVTMKFDV